MNLSNPIVSELTPELLDKQPAVKRTGYTVRVLEDGRLVHLRPQFDPVGFTASHLGKEVEVSSIGLGVRATVIRVLEGYSSKSYTDISL